MSTLRTLNNKADFSAFLYQLDTDLNQHDKASSPGRQALGDMIAKALGARSYEAYAQQQFASQNAPAPAPVASTIVEPAKPILLHLMAETQSADFEKILMQFEDAVRTPHSIVGSSADLTRISSGVAFDTMPEGATASTVQVELVIDWGNQEVTINLGQNLDAWDTQWMMCIDIDTTLNDMVEQVTLACDAAEKNNDMDFIRVKEANPLAFQSILNTIHQWARSLFTPTVVIFPEIGYRQDAPRRKKAFAQFGVIAIDGEETGINIPIFKFDAMHTIPATLVDDECLEHDVSTQWDYRRLGKSVDDYITDEMLEMLREYDVEAKPAIVPLPLIMPRFIADSMLTSAALQAKYHYFNAGSGHPELPYTGFTRDDHNKDIQLNGAFLSYWTWVASRIETFWQETPVFSNV